MNLYAVPYEVFDDKEKINNFYANSSILDKFISKDIEKTLGELSTTLITKETNEVIGFYSLHTSYIKMKSFTNPYITEHRPSINLAYLAVDANSQDTGVGTRLLTHIKKKLVPIYFQVGFNVLTVTSLYESTDFYLRNGFEELTPGTYKNARDKIHINLYMGINDILDVYEIDKKR